MQSNTVVTAGAALGHLDLALTLIRRASPELANLTAKYLVADERTSQAPYTSKYSGQFIAKIETRSW